MEQCPFCDIQKEKERILKEGTFSYVLFSNPRLMPGHLLVIPKRHIGGRIADLTKEEREEIFDFLSEFQTKILERLSSGCDIRQNFKPYVKNSNTHVNHMHWHLHPREFEDELHHAVDPHRKPLYRVLSEQEKEQMNDLLKD